MQECLIQVLAINIQDLLNAKPLLHHILHYEVFLNSITTYLLVILFLGMTPTPNVDMVKGGLGSVAGGLLLMLSNSLLPTLLTSTK